MDQITRIKWVSKHNENEYYFDMPLQAPAGEAYDAVFEWLEEIVKKSKEAADKMKRQEEQKADENKA